MNLFEIAKNAKSAFLKTMNMQEAKKNEVLAEIARLLDKYEEEIFLANKKDLEEAKNLLDKNEINLATYNRLKLDKNKLKDMIQGLKDLEKLENPVNKTLWEKELDDGLILKKITVPIGVIGVIFEARPDCIIQISSLIIKSGNCAILKGGKESINTNKTLFKILIEAFENTNYPVNTVSLIFSREDVAKMLELSKFISLIIPRGSNKLVRYILDNTKIPVLGHASGICHIFVDENANEDNVNKIIIDAKTQYPSACNAVETVLVHKNYPYLSSLKESLIKAGVKIIETPEKFDIEYGDKILNLKIVDNIDLAIEHINHFGSGHTDSILSDNKENIEKFMKLVDSSSVMANCSTRFADGFRYGFGAEVGISTNKTHARGPVGLEGLIIYKYELYGSNNIVEDYAKGLKTFKHKMLTN